MKKVIILLLIMLMAGICHAQFLKISETPTKGYFPLSAQDRVTEICYSDNDFEVVKIAAVLVGRCQASEKERVVNIQFIQKRSLDVWLIK